MSWRNTYRCCGPPPSRLLVLLTVVVAFRGVRWHTRRTFASDSRAIALRDRWRRLDLVGRLVFLPYVVAAEGVMPAPRLVAFVALVRDGGIVGARRMRRTPGAGVAMPTRIMPRREPWIGMALLPVMLFAD